jgi:hypothetical protein
MTTQTLRDVSSDTQHAYFARQDGSWKIVGFERVARGDAPIQFGRKG